MIVLSSKVGVTQNDTSSQKQYLSISCPVGEFKVSKMRADLETFKVYTAVNICNYNTNIVSNILLVHKCEFSFFFVVTCSRGIWEGEHILTFEIIIPYNIKYCSKECCRLSSFSRLE